MWVSKKKMDVLIKRVEHIEGLFVNYPEFYQSAGSDMSYSISLLERVLLKAIKADDIQMIDAITKSLGRLK